MSMSPTEKMIFAALVPFATSELEGPVATYLEANLKSASPQIQAAEKDLAPFLVKAIADVLATLV